MYSNIIHVCCIFKLVVGRDTKSSNMYVFAMYMMRFIVRYERAWFIHIACPCCWMVCGIIDSCLDSQNLRVLENQQFAGDRWVSPYLWQGHFLARVCSSLNIQQFLEIALFDRLTAKGGALSAFAWRVAHFGNLRNSPNFRKFLPALMLGWGLGVSASVGLLWASE